MYYFIDVVMVKQPKLVPFLLMSFDDEQLVLFLELGGYEQLCKLKLDYILECNSYFSLLAKLHAVCAMNEFVHEWTCLRMQMVRCESELQRVISRVSNNLLHNLVDYEHKPNVMVIFEEGWSVRVEGRQSMNSVIHKGTEFSYKLVDGEHYIHSAVPVLTVCSWIGCNTLRVKDIKAGTDMAIWFLPSPMNGNTDADLLLQLVWSHQRRPFKTANRELSRLVLGMSEMQLMRINNLPTPLIRLMASHPELLTVPARLRYLRIFSIGTESEVCLTSNENYILGREMAMAIKYGCPYNKTQNSIECDIERMIKWEPIISKEKQSFIDGFNTVLPFKIAAIFLNTATAWKRIFANTTLACCQKLTIAATETDHQ